MKRVVSVSLGSSKRDKTSNATILDQEFEISRVGTDGDIKRFAEMIVELDGKVDAIGLGGCDRYLWVDDRRYAFRDIDRIARLAKTTPVVDGSGVKNTLERRTIEYLQSNGLVDFIDKRVLLVCATDRFGMAQSIAKLAKEVVFGDLMFNVGVPVPMRSYGAVRLAAISLLPIVTRLPFQWLYPTGEKQDSTQPKYQKYYQWADIIAGDFLIIKKTMPTPESGLLKGKVVITNTLTAEDTQAMIDRKVRMLVTSTPQYDGRYYATNVYEGVLITLMGKRPEDVRPADYEDLLGKLKWRPTITDLTQLGNAE
jgi:hypothetical protein